MIVLGLGFDLLILCYINIRSINKSIIKLNIYIGVRFMKLSIFLYQKIE